MKIKVQDNKSANSVSENEAIQAYKIKKEKAFKETMERMHNGLGLHMPVPTTEDEIRKLADELTDWAHLPDSLALSDFPTDIFMEREVFRQLPDKSKYFNDAYNKALVTLKKKRNDGVKSGKYNKATVYKINQMESPAFLKYLKEKNSKEVDNGKA